jgi:hypothetical protein
MQYTAGRYKPSAWLLAFTSSAATSSRDNRIIVFQNDLQQGIDDISHSLSSQKRRLRKRGWA